MPRVETVPEKDGSTSYQFVCPGCGDNHAPRVGPGSGPRWQFNGNLERPTFSPSLLVRSGHYALGYSSDKCWCTYNAENPDDPAPCSCYICHSFIREGRIQFLGDCTHQLAGKTVDLAEVVS